MTVITNRYEILFIYECKDCNPNGDPLDENRPRTDPETGEATVSDVRIKRTVRDYFLRQWDRFKQYPWGVLAHSTHVKGIGSYENGVEKPRVNVVLATAIPPDRCRKVHLGYMNPADIRIGDYENRQSEGVLVVPHAGEMLHRLSSGEIPRIPDNR